MPVYDRTVESQRRTNLLSFGAFALLPLLLLTDIAATSARCDKLMAKLNEVGIRSAHMCTVRQMEVINLRLTFLEARLSNMHRGKVRKHTCDVQSRSGFIEFESNWLKDLPPRRVSLHVDRDLPGFFF